MYNHVQHGGPCARLKPTPLVKLIKRECCFFEAVVACKMYPTLTLACVGLFLEGIFYGKRLRSPVTSKQVHLFPLGFYTIIFSIIMYLLRCVYSANTPAKRIFMPFQADVDRLPSLQQSLLLCSSSLRFISSYQQRRFFVTSIVASKIMLFCYKVPHFRSPTYSLS